MEHTSMTALRTWKIRAVGTVAAAGFVTAVNAPVQTATAAGLLAAGGIVYKARSRGDKFTRTYLDPCEEALRHVLGDGVRIELRVSRDMGNLTTRMLRDASPAELAARRWYGARIEPVVKFPAVQARRAGDLIAARTEFVRRPKPPSVPSIKLRIWHPYLTPDMRTAIAGAVASKVPVSDTAAHWDSVGDSYRVQWTMKRRPPEKVRLKDIRDAIDQAADDEYVLGLGTGGKAVSVSLGTDSPHICLSARSMSGKSSTVALMAAQSLRRGHKVILLDPKGSHAALRGLVDYCLTAEQCHNALIRAGAEAEERNLLAFAEGLTEWQGQRVVVIAEELNILTPKLRAYWAQTREKDEPKASPAIAAFQSLGFAGRSAKYHLIAIAQYLTANTAGGTELRENLGARLLARYSKNQWTTLCAGTPMPSPASTPGRWYLVIDGDVTEVQVALMHPHEVASLAAPLGSPEQVRPRGHGPLTLRQAVEDGLLDGTFAAVKKRWQRSADRPTPVAKDGQADLYHPADLKAWAAANSGSVK
jgi:hypothetical protein